jgi:hypothetical protein
MVIFLAIAMTAMPYWGKLFPFVWYPLGPLIIVIVTLLGIGIKTLSFLPRKISSIAFAVASLPMWFDAGSFWTKIPAPYNSLFFLGVALYGLQLVIYTAKLCDYRPNLFGYREVQHSMLFLAATLHSIVAVSVVG